VSTEAADVLKPKSVRIFTKIQCAVDVHQIEIREEILAENHKMKSVEKSRPEDFSIKKDENTAAFPLSEIGTFPTKSFSRIVTFSTVENVFAPYIKPP